MVAMRRARKRRRQFFLSRRAQSRQQRACFNCVSSGPQLRLSATADLSPPPPPGDLFHQFSLPRVWHPAHQPPFQMLSRSTRCRGHRRGQLSPLNPLSRASSRAARTVSAKSTAPSCTLPSPSCCVLDTRGSAQEHLLLLRPAARCPQLRALLGAVACHCWRRCCCPVLMLPELAVAAAPPVAAHTPAAAARRRAAGPGPGTALSAH